jgi:hypothetical protein
MLVSETNGPRCPCYRRRTPFRTVRPSLLDLRFTGDPWVVGRGDCGASLYLDGYQLATLAALPFDLPSFNRTLCQLRRRARQ